jgi:hypothetical protein
LVVVVVVVRVVFRAGSFMVPLTFAEPPATPPPPGCAHTRATEPLATKTRMRKLILLMSLKLVSILKFLVVTGTLT